MQGAGNSSTQIEYLTADENPIPGVNHYQLKQTDYDRKFIYCKIVSVNFAKKNIKDNPIVLFSYPSNGHANGHAIIISLHNMAAIYEIRVINIYIRSGSIYCKWHNKYRTIRL